MHNAVVLFDWRTTVKGKFVDDGIILPFLWLLLEEICYFCKALEGCEGPLSLYLFFEEFSCARDVGRSLNGKGTEFNVTESPIQWF